MTKHFRYAIILLSICAISVFALALTNSFTAPIIAKMDAENKLSALEAVSSGLTIGEQKEVAGHPYVTYTIELSENSKVKGYILGLKTSGYGGEITLVASFELQGEMLFAQLLSNSETPGLGKKAEDPAYMDKFKGTGASTPVPTKKSMLSAVDAQSVSGSSVTFGGIAKAIASGSEYVKSLGGAK